MCKLYGLLFGVIIKHKMVVLSVRSLTDIGAGKMLIFQFYPCHIKYASLHSWSLYPLISDPNVPVFKFSL